MTAEERFWSRADRSGGSDACWPWLQSLGSGGYGIWRIAIGRNRTKTFRAHRMAWEMGNGAAIPPGIWVLHRCDNRPCCNPAHLSLGTRADNVADMVAKGRQAKGDRNSSRSRPDKLARGSTNGRAKLSESDCVRIRSLRQSGVTLREIAGIFGINDSHVSRIAKGKRWSHV